MVLSESWGKYKLTDKAIDRLLNLGLALSIIALLASFTTTPSPKKTETQPTAQYNSSSLSVTPVNQRQPFEELSVLTTSSAPSTEAASAAVKPVTSSEPLKTSTPDDTHPTSPSNPLQSLTSSLGRLVYPTLSRLSD